MDQCSWEGISRSIRFGVDWSKVKVRKKIGVKYTVSKISRKNNMARETIYILY